MKLDGWAFVTVLLLICLLGEMLKTVRAPGLVLIIFIAILYARSAILRKQNAPALLFCAVGVVYIGLSYLGALPRAWTRYHETDLIPQQAAYVFGLLPFMAASQKWWDDAYFDRYRQRILILLVLAAFVLSAPVNMLLNDSSISNAINDHRVFSTLKNEVLIGFVAASYLAIRCRRWTVTGAVAFIALAAVSTVSDRLQSVITYLILLSFIIVSVYRLRVERWMLLMLFLLMVGFAIVGMRDPQPIFALDSNTGWRLVFWRDGIDAIIQTGGVGVGFGTEALRNNYGFVLGRDYFVQEEESQFIATGAHNVFVDTTLRLGIGGLIAFCWMLVRCLPRPEMPSQVRAHSAAVFALLLVCIYSNVALASPIYFLGVGFALGYLQSTRRQLGMPGPIVAPVQPSSWFIGQRQRLGIMPNIV